MLRIRQSPRSQAVNPSLGAPARLSASQGLRRALPFLALAQRHNFSMIVLMHAGMIPEQIMLTGIKP